MSHKHAYPVSRGAQKTITSKQKSFVGVLDIAKGVLIREIGEFVCSANTQWRWFEANDPKPAHWHAKIEGVDVHLRDGLTPPKNGETLVVRIEVKVRKVSATFGSDKHQYVYLNLFPTVGDEQATHLVTVTKERPINHDSGTVTYCPDPSDPKIVRGKVFRSYVREAEGMVSVIELTPNPTGA